MSYLLWYPFLIVCAAFGGCISACLVFGSAAVLQQRFGIHREGFASLLTLFGLVATFVGQHYQLAWCAWAGLLWGWIVLIPLALGGYLVWHVLRFTVFLFREVIVSAFSFH